MLLVNAKENLYFALLQNCLLYILRYASTYEIVMVEISLFYFFRYRREGSVEKEDRISSVQEGSGSGDEIEQAQRLAESLALNNIQIGTKSANAKTAAATKRGFLPPTAMHDDTSMFNEKRNKITRPPKASKQSKKRNKVSKRSSEKKSEISTTASSTSSKNDTSAEVKKASVSSSSSSSSRPEEQKNDADFVDPAISKDFIAKYSVEPKLNMRVRCKVPGKESPMKGSLKYLGRISNLPKRSNVVVAGLQLEHEEDLGTDGTFLGKRYFTAPTKRGYFVPMKNCTPM